jgi:maleate isomerase
MLTVIHPLNEVPHLDERAFKKRIGLVILATDHTTEPDFATLVANERIGIYVNRVPYANPVTPDNLRAMQPSLTAGAALILPDEALDVVMYSCTSASVMIGDAEVETAIHAAKPGAQVVTPTAAAVTALKTLGARRISVLTPYTVETKILSSTASRASA